MSIPPINIGGDFGKALAKGIHELSRHFGRRTEPDFIRKTADAEAYKTRVQAEADAYASQVLARANYENAKLLESGRNEREEIIVSREEPSEEAKLLVERTLSNSFHQQLREQSNKDNIAGYATEELFNTPDENVSDAPVEPDWMSRFFDMARHISDDEMQKIWGKILAGEVISPGSYSLRTLEVMRNLSKQEAIIFSAASRYAIQNQNNPFIFYDYTGSDLSKNHPLSYGKMLLLSQVGLVTLDSNLSIAIRHPSNNLLTYGSYRFLVTTTRRINIPAIAFTPVGAELLGLILQDGDEIYYYQLLSYLAENKAQIYSGKISTPEEKKPEALMLIEKEQIDQMLQSFKNSTDLSSSAETNEESD